MKKRVALQCTQSTYATSISLEELMTTLIRLPLLMAKAIGNSKIVWSFLLKLTILLSLLPEAYGRPRASAPSPSKTTKATTSLARTSPTFRFDPIHKPPYVEDTRLNKFVLSQLEAQAPFSTAVCKPIEDKSSASAASKIHPISPIDQRTHKRDALTLRATPNNIPTYLLTSKPLSDGELVPELRVLSPQIEGSCFFRSVMVALSQSDSTYFDSLIQTLPNGDFRVGPFTHQDQPVYIIVPSSHPQLDINDYVQEYSDSNQNGIVDINAQVLDIAFNTLTIQTNLDINSIFEGGDTTNVLNALPLTRGQFDGYQVENLTPEILESMMRMATFAIYSTEGHSVTVGMHFDVGEYTIYDPSFPHEPQEVTTSHFQRGILVVYSEAPDIPTYGERNHLEYPFLRVGYLYLGAITYYGQTEDGTRHISVEARTYMQCVRSAPIRSPQLQQVSCMIGDTLYEGTQIGPATIQGSIYDPDFTYNGTFVYQRPHGHGEQITHTETYQGTFRQGDYHGHGKLTKRDGNTYEGEFKLGQPEGQGTWTKPNGVTIEGQFKEGQAHGFCTQTNPSGQVYRGHYKEGKKHGQGIQTTKTGRQYKCHYTEGTLTQRTLITPHERDL